MMMMMMMMDSTVQAGSIRTNRYVSELEKRPEEKLKRFVTCSCVM